MSRLMDALGAALAGDEARPVLTSSALDVLVRDWKVLAETRRHLLEGFDPELSLQVKGRPMALADINRELVTLKNYLSVSRRWTRIFAFGSKRAAAQALAALGLVLDEPSLKRAIAFYEGLKARILLSNHFGRLFGSEPERDDDAWRRFLCLLDDLHALADLLLTDASLERDGLRFRLVEGEAAAASASLARSAARARALHAALEMARAQGILRDTRLAEWDRALREGQSGSALAGRIRQAASRLEGIDTQRVEAAFKELGERIEEKQGLVQKLVVRNWRQRQTNRLLASTGSRLGPDGSALRQRLYIRGKKALRLRQMIAAGDAHPGGDPLYDLCPVWMASPNTVAQIFPREAVFDLVVFDEASQCRLEEALPVLMRAKRLVVAGDAKQLPPTRFFESAMAESDDGDYQDEQDLHERQMSEMEDLLGAALNLDFHQAFLDVHCRSRYAELIGYSNLAFYGGRLQPIPGPPAQSPTTPIRLVRDDGLYTDQTNPAEADAAVELVAQLLNQAKPPSVGIATFNLKQRNLILEKLDEKAAADPEFASRLEIARNRQGRDSFEGLFVKNLENVQGDERDVIIISTTFGRDAEGRFRRNFGALSQSGGERRLNVLVTRSRQEIHVLTSIPREEYTGSMMAGAALSGRPEGVQAPSGRPEGVQAPSGRPEGVQAPKGRHHLYGYLAFAERVETERGGGRQATAGRCEVRELRTPSPLARAFGQLLAGRGYGSTVHWGNDGFTIDIAVADPDVAGQASLGLLTDFNRYRNTPDPIQWEWFRSQIHRAQGWRLERLWSPRLYRDLDGERAGVESLLASKEE